jgi:RNA-binding protein YlmH
MERHHDARLDRLLAHVDELCDRAVRGNFTYTSFLTPREAKHARALLCRKGQWHRAILWGGYEGAERQLAVFGSEEEFGFWEAPPIKCILVSPVMQKFADDLSHRDFLGSVMGLGIKREAIGDIIIKNNTGYVFCLDTVAEYIAENLKKVCHTTVKCEITKEVPSEVNPELEEKIIIAASERLDVIIAEIYNLSRSESNTLFTAKKVFVNGKLTENNSQKIKTDDVVSVRGYGRFTHCEILGETKKRTS